MKWEALDIPDPETPVGARGIGEPPVGGGRLRGAECDFGRGWRRDLPPRAGDARRDPDVARSRAAGDGDVDGEHLDEDAGARTQSARLSSAWAMRARGTVYPSASIA